LESEKHMADYIPVLTFHRIDDSRSVISYRPDLFRRLMEKLHRQGYMTLRLTDAAELIRRHESFPEKSFVITFDDGYRSVYEEALPVICRHSMTATVFLTVGNSNNAQPDDRPPPLGGFEMLSWGEIRTMTNAGIDFGAHTLSHPDLTVIDRDAIAYEITGAKDIIERNLGIPVLSFAYPYGRYDEKSLEIARQNFSCACSDRLGLLTGESPLYALERVDSYYIRSDKLIDLMLTKSFPLYIWLRGIPRAIRRRVSRR
jgi:peptidoglycan/xylan/chitin deacetylase (PgdA/CDA1 family)